VAERHRVQRIGRGGSSVTDELKRWHLYVVRCSDGSLYTGVTTNVTRRVQEHNGQGSAGARYTRTRRPAFLVASWGPFGKVDAHRLEYRFKRLTRAKKDALLGLPAGELLHRLLTPDS